MGKLLRAVTFGLVAVIAVGCAPQPNTVYQKILVPVAAPCIDSVPDDPALTSLSRLTPLSPPAETVKAYVEAVETLRDAVTERDHLLAGCTR